MQLNLQGIEQSKSASGSHCGNDDNGQLRCDDMTDAQYNVALGSTVWYNKNLGGASVRINPPIRLNSQAISISSRAIFDHFYLIAEPNQLAAEIECG